MNIDFYGGRLGRRRKKNKSILIKIKYFLIFLLAISLLVSLFEKNEFNIISNISGIIKKKENSKVTIYPLEESSKSSRSSSIFNINDELKKTLASDNVSWCFLDLKTGEKIGNNIDREMQVASLSKLSVLYTVMLQIKENKIDWENKIAFTSDDYITGSGVLQETIDEGDSYSIRELCRLLLEKSDNIAYRMLMRTVGQDVVKEKLNSEGMSIRFEDGNYMSANSVALLLRDIWELILSGKNDFAEVLGWMASSSYRDGIPAALSDNDYLVANKEGNISGSVLADSGVILTSHPYILVVITNGMDDDEGYGIIHSIAEAFSKKAS
ncbi:class A beta-lactamase-related serine hydrolase [Pelotomaculum isophthalicicum JI]|uniref:Class A beta-lactamase-related serine hydrolase n=1 Tax=Pelotomaculum isophthalicicum JI TaxID=947010 RepID=A0A9X4H590_9FIRM|nr:serine hydrolase [Pelotomaculum isophthalicicum]MDF9409438.1 class A beta-lactamase-related serine hydrolase [Pelotomaculum isophthalicicum JI]